MMPIIFNQFSEQFIDDGSRPFNTLQKIIVIEHQSTRNTIALIVLLSLCQDARYFTFRIVGVI